MAKEKLKYLDVLAEVTALLKSFTPTSWNIRIKLTTKKGNVLTYENKGGKQ